MRVCARVCVGVLTLLAFFAKSDRYTLSSKSRSACYTERAAPCLPASLRDIPRRPRSLFPSLDSTDPGQFDYANQAVAVTVLET